jgi:hypothetical protein
MELIQTEMEQQTLAVVVEHQEVQVKLVEQAEQE